jgi:hypothetical protein
VLGSWRNETFQLVNSDSEALLTACGQHSGFDEVGDVMIQVSDPAVGVAWFPSFGGVLVRL